METVSLTNLVDFQGDILVDFVVDADNGIVTARASLCNVKEKIGTATGYSFTHPDDKFDEGIGIALAGGRAIQELGSRMIRSANKDVNKKDKFRRSQKKASQEAVAARKEKSAKIKAEREGLPESYGNFRIGDRVKAITSGGMREYNGTIGTVTVPPHKFSIYITVQTDKFGVILFKPEELMHIQTREDLPA